MKPETTVIFVWWPLCNLLERDILWCELQRNHSNGEVMVGVKAGESSRISFLTLGFWPLLFCKTLSSDSNLAKRGLVCFCYILLSKLFQIFICLLKKVWPLSIIFFMSGNYGELPFPSDEQRAAPQVIS